MLLLLAIMVWVMLLVMLLILLVVLLVYMVKVLHIKPVARFLVHLGLHQ